MTFSQYAGIAIVPTFARVVLAAVFVSVGWNKVFKDAEFTAEQATQLRALGVNTEPVQTVASAGGFDASSRFALASYRQEASPPPPPSQPPADDATPADENTPPSAPTDDPKSETPPVAQEPLPAGMYKAQALHQLTLMLHENNFPQPVWMARLAAFTELIGGAMLLLGLFSRIWGLGLAIAMGVAFYLVSMKTNGIFTMDPRTFAENGQAMSTAAVQMSLFVLAFGVLLTGPGPLSLDRLLFGGGDDGAGGEDSKID